MTGFPKGVTENQVYTHFQKGKNGGGEIEKVTLLSGGKAMVAFADPKGLSVFQILQLLVYFF